MIRWLIISICIFFSFNGEAQNIYDLNHTKRYADYLYSSKEYKRAALEYERALFMGCKDSSVYMNFFKSLRISGSPDLGKSVLRDFMANNQVCQPGVSDEYIKLMLSRRSFVTADSLIKQWNPYSKDFLRASSFVLQRKYKDFDSLYSGNNMHDESLKGIKLKVEDITNVKLKSPLLAASMSIVIPGTGKMYYGDWKDGFVSLLIVAANAWQSYRGFSKKGSDSAYGWISAGVSLGFYSGNIWGTWKGTKRRNKRLLEEKYYNAEEYIYNNF